MASRAVGEITEENQDLAKQTLHSLNEMYETMTELNIRIKSDSVRLKAHKTTGNAPGWRCQSMTSDGDIVRIMGVAASLKNLCDDLVQNITERESGVKEVVNMRQTAGRRFDSGYKSAELPNPIQEEGEDNMTMEGFTDSVYEV